MVVVTGRARKEAFHDVLAVGLQHKPRGPGAQILLLILSVATE